MREQGLISLDLMNKLMSFDTTSDQSNLPMINFIRDYLENLGVESYLTYDQFETKANLFATIGPSGEPGVVISGHTDVVPVTNQRWSVEPYALTKKGERF